jgi:LysR family transcriptional regulator, glycine cleavage system transcriptional activator
MNLIHTARMRALPPFDGLIAFETTLRHRSMTLAANELGLTQSAISHRVKKLEAFVGAKLLMRTSAGLSPTIAGLSLSEGLSELLDEMAELRARSRAAVRPAALKVAVGQALANYWLVRRLPRFASSFPEVALELVTVENEAQARAAGADVQILWLLRAAARASSTQRFLFNETVFPVAAQSLLPRGRPLEDPVALAKLPVIHKGPAGRNDGAEWSWPVWFERLGIETGVPAGLRFDTIGTALAAALQGAGVVLARSLLVCDAIADQRLYRVLSSDLDMPSSKTHIIRWPAALTGDKRVRAFAAWITKEAGTNSEA